MGATKRQMAVPRHRLGVFSSKEVNEKAVCGLRDMMGFP